MYDLFLSDGEVFLVRFRKRLSFELLFSTTVFAVVSVFTLVLHIAFPGFRFQFWNGNVCTFISDFFGKTTGIYGAGA